MGKWGVLILGIGLAWGNIVVVGSYGKGENRDGLVIKLDNNGKKVWGKVIDTGGIEVLRCGVKTETGYLLGGSRTDPAGVQRGWLVGITKSGKTLWNMEVPGVKQFTQIVPAKDGNFIATAQGEGGDALLIKMDKLGRQLWRRKLGIYHNTSPLGIIPLGGAGYLIVGQKLYIKHFHKGLIIKTDDHGHKLWGIEVGGNGNILLHSGVELPNGEIAVVGEVRLPSGYWGGVILKLAPDGTQKWIRFFHSGKRSRFTGVTIGNGEIVAVGDSTGWGRGKGDGIAVGYSFTGNQLWLKSFGTSSPEKVENYLSNGEEGVAIGESSFPTGKGWVVSLSSNFTPQWSYTTPFQADLFGGIVEENFTK
jgi:outer membrane protein assembly factor BamB